MIIEIKKERMTDSIIEKVIEIDKTFYLDFDYSDTSWYYDRYNENNEITTLYVNSVLVGYYLFYSITQDLLQDILDLKYSGDYDFPYDQVNVSSDINYLPSVLVLSEYQKYSIPLLIALRHDFINRDKVVAIAISTEGKKMCKKNMTLIGSPRENIEVYYKGKI